MLTIEATHIEQIKQHGEADYPYECCGLMLGTFASDGQKTVTEILPISNAREEESKRNRFLITPLELMKGEKYARSKKLDIVGFYHSHPDHPAVPSGFDLDHALPVYSYVIVSVREGRAGDFFSWEMEHDRTQFNSEELVKG